MPSLYALKPWYTRRLMPIVDVAVAKRISPNVFTAAGVLAAAAAGVAITLGLWAVAALFLALRLAGANLDGAVARARGVSRPWGFVINEIGDRTSDLLAFAGLAAWAAQQNKLADWATPQNNDYAFHWRAWPVLMVLAAALASTLPTFASLAAAAAGTTRHNGGPLGKTERCLIFVLATAFPHLIAMFAVLLFCGSVLTTVLRFRSAHLELTAQRQGEQEQSDAPVQAADIRPAMTPMRVRNVRWRRP